VLPVVYYPYHPNTCRALLARLGFRDTDGDKVLNWTRGPLKGQDLAIAMITPSDASTTLELAEGLVAFFAEVGVKINFRPMRSTGIRAAVETGRWELILQRMEPEFAVPFTRADDLAPVRNESPGWHRRGKAERTLQPFEQKLVDLIKRFRRESDLKKRMELMAEYNRVFTENVYAIGILVGRHGLAMARRFRNIPAGAMSFLYQWSTNNVLPEQIWVARQEQLKEVMPGTVPLYPKRTPVGR